jgi:tRNA A37 methylthiotransferase MiaB
MPIETLLITPPFTQLNTAYPATMYLKGFLEAQHKVVHQCDLSILLFNALFTKEKITQVFIEANEVKDIEFPLVWQQRAQYIEAVETVIQFLRQQEVTAAYQILQDHFLPKAHRFEQLEEDLSWAFGNLGILDKAKHYATLFIEELGDFIQANIDEFFAFTKYAEQIASSANSFNTIDTYLGYETTLIEDTMLTLLETKILEFRPKLVGFTIPFPGNLFAALRCAQWIKTHQPTIKVVFGGGYCNTELRSLSDPRIFKYVDFITLDDGEGPLLSIIDYLSNTKLESDLERTYLLKNGKVVYQNRLPNTIFHHKDLPAPSYKGLPLHAYLSFLDVMNPMHRLWSDGRWNKLTISHGCYWKQCSFCDVHLDYIGNYQNTTATALVDKIEQLIAETGTRGFHFVDEAAPPKMLKAMAEELIERRVFITWWTNIRFEKSFTPELCALLAKSGCIAVTGGLEVASDRLLNRMKKGVTIEQVAKVSHAFAENNILVHAYLMYGFPTQTEQETIDSLEIVRQLLLNGCIHSGFWHRFTATAHSPVGSHPEQFEIKITGPTFEGFALNDLTHEDPTGANHDDYKEGLNAALSNYLNGIGLEEDLQTWFDFEIPKTQHAGNLIEKYVSKS